MNDAELKQEFEILSSKIEGLKPDPQKEHNRHNEELQRQRRDHRRQVLGISFTSGIALASLIVTTISIVSNLGIGKETLRQKKLERIDKLEAEFDDSLTSRQRKSSIAHELYNTRDTTILSIEDQMRFGEYYLSYHNAVKDKNETTTRINKAIDSTSNDERLLLDTAKLNIAEKEQVNLENSLNEARNPTEQARLENKLKVVSEKFRPTPAVGWLDSLSSNQIALTRLEKSSSSNQPDVTWIKEGYSRILGDLRIELKVFVPVKQKNGGSGTLYVRSKAGGSGYIVIGFTVPGKKTFTLKGVRYEIEFVRIDRAGKNPFSMAVYFSLSKVQSRDSFDKSFDRSFLPSPWPK